MILALGSLAPVGGKAIEKLISTSIDVVKKPWTSFFAWANQISNNGAIEVEALEKVSAIGSRIASASNEANQASEFAIKYGIKLNAGPTATKIDKVIIETLESKGNVTSAFKLTSNEALEAGKKWVGEGYMERNSGSGVFVSADGKRQFRIDSGSLAGSHAPNIPHVHFEEIDPETGKFKTNNHVPFED